MRIIHITPYYEPFHQFGGPTFSIPSIVLHCSQFSEQIVITQNHDHLNNTFIIEQNENKKIVYLPKSKILGKTYFYSHLLKHTIKELITTDTIIHVHTLFNHFSRVGLSFSKQIKLILSPRGMLDKYSLTRNKWLKKYHYWLFDQRNLNYLSLIHFTAEDERRNIAITLNQIPTQILPNIMNIPDFKVVKKENLDKFRFIYIGRLNKKKAIDISIRAFANLKNEGIENIQFDIYGPDDDEVLTELKLLIDQNKLESMVNIKPSIYGEEKYHQLRLADYFISTSHQENFGMSVVESLSVGTPVIISKAINIYPEIEKNGLGYVLDENNDKSLSNLIKNLISRKSENGYKEKLHQYVIDHYSGPALAPAYQNMYQRILNS